MDIMDPNSKCPNGPVFIWSVRKISPAAAAGIQSGDRLLAIDDTPIRDFNDAVHRISSESPQPVPLQLERLGSVRSLIVKRERSDIIWSQNGLRMLDDGLLVGSEFSDAEIQEVGKLNRDLEAAMRSGNFRNVFPGHYPKDKSLYYPGFEVFVWDKGEQVHVGGIEDGPASRNGVRWGDRILSINGVDPRGKSLSELESLLSSKTSAGMSMTIERAGTPKTFNFSLAPAADVLRDNNWQIVNGAMVPLWVPKSYTSCFE
jgi:C-terminal processing protease CtpA/Prc